MPIRLIPRFPALPPLRYMLLGTMLVLGLGLIGFNTLYFLDEDRERALAGAELRCKREGSRIARLIKTHLRNDRVEAALAELERTGDELQITHVTVCSQDLHVLYDMDPTLVGAYLPERSAAVSAVPFVADGKYHVHHVELPGRQHRIVGYFPFVNSKRPQTSGVVVMELDLNETLHEASEVARANAIGASVALAVAMGLLGLVLHGVITQRAAHILSEASALALGGPTREPLKGNDELAQIDQALRDAYARIAEQGASLRAREERYRLIVETLTKLVMIVREERVEFINSTGLQMLHASQPKQVLGHCVSEFLASDYLTAIAREPSPRWLEDENDGRMNCVDGAQLIISATASTFTDELGQATQIVVQDITERRAAEERRAAREREIALERQRLEREIVRASERAQRRMGQDLHDDICQRLAAVKIKLQDLEERLVEHSPALVHVADNVVESITDAIRVTRNLARGLSPVDIEAGGLGSAMQGLVRSSKELFGIACSLDLEDDLPEMPNQTATQCYRIAQECVANAAKHGQAHSVHVCLNHNKEQELIIRVSNDGLPFPTPDQLTPGMGLAIMRYRAESIGATLEFQRQPADASFAVVCTVPLSPSTTPIPA